MDCLGIARPVSFVCDFLRLRSCFLCWIPRSFFFAVSMVFFVDACWKGVYGRWAGLLAFGFFLCFRSFFRCCWCCAFLSFVSVGNGFVFLFAFSSFFSSFFIIFPSLFCFWITLLFSYGYDKIMGYISSSTMENKKLHYYLVKGWEFLGLWMEMDWLINIAESYNIISHLNLNVRNYRDMRPSRARMK